MWLAKGMALFWGAVMTLALVFGAASMALAANGQPFLLGRATNAATALTKLTANVNGSAMQVQNTNVGTDDTALNLAVQEGEAPMRVNSDARVANLNSDQIDGKDSAAFLGVDAKARDASRADFASFAGEAQIAQAAGIKGYELVKEKSVFDSSTTKGLSAGCPEGKRIIGGGGNVFPSLGDPNHESAPIALQVNGVNSNGFDSWDVRAVEVNPYEPSWVLSARAVCADEGTP